MLCDTPPPPSPGNSQVNAWAKIIKEAAQVKAAAERKVGTALAAHRRSEEIYDRVMTASERQVKKRGLGIFRFLYFFS